MYICPDWDENGEFYLMNNANAAWYMGKEATQINAFIGMCSNQTDEIDDISVYDETFVDPGWGFKKPNEPDCYPNETIREFL